MLMEVIDDDGTIRFDFAGRDAKAIASKLVKADIGDVAIRFVVGGVAKRNKEALQYTATFSVI